MTRINAEKPISERLEAILSELSPNQLRFVVARQQYSTDTAAARAIGVKRDVVYRWPAVVKEAVRLMAEDAVAAALHLRRRALAKAMAVKAAGLDSKDEKVRQSAATEIIEWELGRAAQRQELTGADGGAIVVSWDDAAKPSDD